jgi:hypothetical protein
MTPTPAQSLARELFDRRTNPSVLRRFCEDLETKLPGSPLRLFLVQAHLRIDELFGSLLDVVENDRGSVATMLSRAQLETAAFLLWIAVTGEADDWEDRLIRLVGHEISNNRQRYPGAEPLHVYAELEQRALSMKKPPNARNAMEEVDKALRQRGGTPFFESQYAHYALASSHLHSFQYGPAHFTGSPTGPIRWDSRDAQILNRSALRYGITYFTVGHQALLILIGRGANEKLEIESLSAREVAEQELREVANPGPSGWEPR